jgi:hypothetical protein
MFGILKNKNKYNISEIGSVSVLRSEKETPTLLGPLERAHTNT